VSRHPERARRPAKRGAARLDKLIDEVTVDDDNDSEHLCGLFTMINRDADLRMHVRAAFNNGVTRDEIKEVLLQCTIFCGVQAACHSTQAVFAEMNAAAKR